MRRRVCFSRSGVIPEVHLSVLWNFNDGDQCTVSFDSDIANFGGFSGMMFKPSTGEGSETYLPHLGAAQLDARSCRITMPIDATGINVDCSLQFDDGTVQFLSGGRLAGIPTYDLIHNGGARPSF